MSAIMIANSQIVDFFIRLYLPFGVSMVRSFEISVGIILEKRPLFQYFFDKQSETSFCLTKQITFLESLLFNNSVLN